MTSTSSSPGSSTSSSRISAPSSSSGSASSGGRRVVRLSPVGRPGPGDWRVLALCREVDPELFFPEKGESAAEALRVCAGCTVRVECAAEALERGERFGVWGGLTEQERRADRRAARRSPVAGEAA